VKVLVRLLFALAWKQSSCDRFVMPRAEVVVL